LTIHLVEEMSIDHLEQYSEGVTESEAAALTLAWRLMHAEGMVDGEG
jgi:hypothetical protein